MGEEFILTIAGEDSGDALGEEAVKETIRSGFKSIGAGGQRMRMAGLEAAANFEDMAVSGIFDVLKKLPKLLSIKSKFAKLLRSESCKALVCIDYPGMNLPLAKLAKKIGKPVYYIAPPKIWAWRKSRGKHFKDISVWVFFDFEKEIYESFGAKARIVKHPCFSNANVCEGFKDKVLFLPGSRIGQVRRNLPKYIEIARQHGEPLFVAPRKEILDFLNDRLGGEFPAVLKPAGSSFAGAKAVVCMPGTAALEAYAAGVPATAVAVIDPLTYIIGKLFLKTKYLTLPNIILQREAVPEYIFIYPIYRALCKRWIL